MDCVERAPAFWIVQPPSTAPASWTHAIRFATYAATNQTGAQKWSRLIGSKPHVDAGGNRRYGRAGKGFMPKYIIEREIPGAGKLSANELRAISQKSCGVLNQLGPQ